MGSEICEEGVILAVGGDTAIVVSFKNSTGDGVRGQGIGDLEIITSEELKATVAVIIRVQ